MITTVAPEFTEAGFFDNIRAAAAALGAPFSPEITRRVLGSYAESFRTGAVVWKTTDRPGAGLNYRFFSRLRMDTIAIAVQAGLLEPDNPLAAMIQDWSALYGGAPAQSCDFDAGRGLAKTWVHLGGTRPVMDVLEVKSVPDSLRKHLPAFDKAGLRMIRFAAVNYHHNAVNLYFRARGPLSYKQCAAITGLVRVPSPDADLVAEIARFVPHDFCVAVTASLDTDQLERVCFYALKLPKDGLPRIPDRLALFFSAAPSYDADETNVVGWSFGSGHGTYFKAERSCFGGMAALLNGWASFFSGSTQRDSAL